MDVGWHAPTAASWSRPAGGGTDSSEQRDIPSVLDGGFDPTGCFQPLLDDLESDLRAQLRQGAVQHPHGEGLEVGAAVWSGAAALREKRAARPARAEPHIRDWPALDRSSQRRARIPAGEQKLCDRCQGAEETLMHRVRTCPKNVEHQDF